MAGRRGRARAAPAADRRYVVVVRDDRPADRAMALNRPRRPCAHLRRPHARAVLFDLGRRMNLDLDEARLDRSRPPGPRKSSSPSGRVRVAGRARFPRGRFRQRGPRSPSARRPGRGASSSSPDPARKARSKPSLALNLVAPQTSLSPAILSTIRSASPTCSSCATSERTLLHPRTCSWSLLASSRRSRASRRPRARVRKSPTCKLHPLAGLVVAAVGSRRGSEVSVILALLASASSPATMRAATTSST